jgi:hypothetical protein
MEKANDERTKKDKDHSYIQMAEKYLIEAVMESESVIGKRITKPEIVLLTDNEANPGVVEGVYDPDKQRIGIWPGFEKEHLKRIIRHEFFHHVIHNALHMDLRDPPDKEKYPFAFPLWDVLIEMEIVKGRLSLENFIEEGMASFFGAVSLTNNENEFYINPIYNLFRHFHQNWEEDPLFILENTERIMSSLVGIYALLYGLNGAFTPKNEEEDKRRIDRTKTEKWSDVNIYYIGYVIVLFLWEKYKLEKKNFEILLRDFFVSPYQMVNELVKEIKKDKDMLLLKKLLSDISTVIEPLIPNWSSQIEKGVRGEYEGEAYKHIEKFRNQIEIEEKVKQKVNEENLLTACEEDDVKKAKEALENGASLTGVEYTGYAPITIAAVNGSVNVLKLLIKEGEGKGGSINSMEDAFRKVLKQFIREHGFIVREYISDAKLKSKLYEIEKGERIIELWGEEETRELYLKIHHYLLNPKLKKDLESFDKRFLGMLKSLRMLECIEILAEALEIKENNEGNLSFKGRIRGENKQTTKIKTHTS